MQSFDKSRYPKSSSNLENKPQIVGLRSLPRRQVALTMAGTLLAMFLSSLNQMVVATAMPRIVADLGGFADYTWVTTSYLVASTVVMPITGRLTDMYGRKWFYTAGLFVFIIGSILCGLSQTMTQIIAARGFQGLGAGIMMSIAFTIIGDLFPPAERGKYQGLVSGTFGIASVIGPTLGGLITDSLSWHWVFYMNVPLGAMVILLFVFFFPDLRPASFKHNIDYAGATALVLATVPVLLALSWGGSQYPWISVQIVGMLVFSFAMSIVFIIIEKRSKEPIIPLELFHNQIVAVSITATFFCGIAMFGSITFIPLFFQGVLGLSATTSGNFLTPMMLGVVVGSSISGQVLSRTGGHYRLQGVIGVAIMALGIWLLSRMTGDTSYATAVTAIVLTGIGLGATMPLYTIAVQNAVPYNIMGVATSATSFFRFIGGSFGLAILGSAMTSRFSAELLGKLPATLKAAIPTEMLNSLASNPEALVSIQAQEQLKGFFSSMGSQGTALFEQLLLLLRTTLNSALSMVFIIAVAAVLIALVFTFFLKEIPLKKQHSTGNEN